MTATTTASPVPFWHKARQSTFAFIFLWIAVIWSIEIVDTFVLSDRLQANGIQPRRNAGLDGILWAPFLHSNFGHVLSNTLPFIVLGGLIAIRGKKHWILVTVTAIFVGGLLTWIIARGSNHIGSSGVVFSYLGALIGTAIFERRLVSIAPALVAILLYGSILIGLVPQSGISWEGHLTGLLTGMAIAFWVAKTKPLKPLSTKKASEPFPWGDDEPWAEQ